VGLKFDIKKNLYLSFMIAKSMFLLSKTVVCYEMFCRWRYWWNPCKSSFEPIRIF